MLHLFTLFTHIATEFPTIIAICLVHNMHIILLITMYILFSLLLFEICVNYHFDTTHQ